PKPPAGFDADVFIQAGHENTPDNKTGGEGPLGNEIDWTPIVADEATRILRQAGVSTIREDASLKRPERQNQRFRVRIAVFLHFDKGVVPVPDSPSDGPDSHSADSMELHELHVVHRWRPARLPDNATRKLRAAAGVPWAKAAAMPRYRSNRGMMTDSFCVFQN